ncbi:hypothetical protein [Sphaerimonospora thailandensis]|uniref:Uncharacterized protein n=1 Tax=Sphaerimonospora thailandensis TaxID=795644 RepID=A0A8J3RBW7_9ACTN|nr:hypothetical protein [Sphaerimonospora thailandensis]GIH72173.1 hypothetical protein Mth01_44260 [Sphaerimonospora thailandensis]
MTSEHDLEERAADPMAALAERFPEWTIWRSSARRLWATRARPFPPAAERAGAYRTVDADDLGELGQVIAEQEYKAEGLR